MCYIFCNFMFKIKVEGLENLPALGGFILASNHITDFDPLLIGISLKRQLFFMAKVELFKNRVARTVLNGLGAFPVDRAKGDNTALYKAIDTVKSGGVLAIFPEGTRSKDGELLRFKSGAIVVAAQTGADIVPTSVYIKDIKNGWKFRSQVVVRYGKVIKHEDLQIDVKSTITIKKANTRVKNAIEGLLEESK